ncbi:hypothetical protein RGR602_PC00944 (plasmid) [Rhizobium gallicum bv. gallicum R602sp]|uniref:Uncharacterized protein n=1 Tax=Rhizobium gallicum bv. gallicum R602sp TaxID=1041138 RepID=A0A0B4XEU1_9HYPH|nr:hypothetical protein RGR602_PC00944 [Rhizobium gallicum bv. gallicum R602sp]
MKKIASPSKDQFQRANNRSGVKLVLKEAAALRDEKDRTPRAAGRQGFKRSSY